MSLLHRTPDTDAAPEVVDRDRDGVDDRVERRGPDRRDGRTAVATPAAGTIDERTSYSTHEGWNTAARIVAMVAAGVALVIGVVALFRIDWVDGLDSGAVDVAGLIMTPKVAIATVVAGLIALAAAASSDRSSKLVLGVVLVVVGVAILAIGDGDRLSLQVEQAHGWLALGVGAVLLLSGLVMRRSWTTHRSVDAARW